MKTSYKHFLDWYFCQAFQKFLNKGTYLDTLLEIKNNYTSTTSIFNKEPNTVEEVISMVKSTKFQNIKYKSNFLERLLNTLKINKWVDIEHYYYRLLKANFSNINLKEKKEVVLLLNQEFNAIIEHLSNYIITINNNLVNTSKMKTQDPSSNFGSIFNSYNIGSEVKFLNFNYTDTLYIKYLINEKDIIHIHGRVSDINQNPIIFGYGDESDPTYQNIEDSGENIYLEHIKSFGYFRTDNYHRLLSYIDSEPYTVSIIGHSCGLSDRVLLNEIFEHSNCKNINIFYHVRKDGSDNFKEITQEISRHFKPQNKNLMRRRLSHKDPKNIIPQN